MALNILLVVAGLALLIWGADRFVHGAAASARNLGVAPLLVGLTVVALATSAPEKPSCVNNSRTTANADALCKFSLWGSLRKASMSDAISRRSSRSACKAEWARASIVRRDKPAKTNKEVAEQAE